MTKDFLTEAVQLNAVRLLQGTADPRAGAGVAAPEGSKYFRSGATPGDFTKTGAADTSWTLVSADIYFNVSNYGAAGDGVTDDRGAIQLAINDAAVAGGTVFFPSGSYDVGFDGANQPSFDLTGKSNIRFLGAAQGGVTLTFTGNAAGGKRVMFRLDTTSSIEFEGMTFSQAGLTNPLANQCHIFECLDDVDITKWINCRFLGGVASGGAYIFMSGSGATDRVTNAWVSECEMSACGSASIWIDGFVSTIWIEDNTIEQLGSVVDTVLIAETNGGAITDVKLYGNEITNDTQYAVRVTAASGQLISRLHIGDGNVLQGFVSVGWCDQAQIASNDILATAAAITDAVVVIEGQTTQVQFQGNTVGRGSTCADGVVLEVIPGAVGEVSTRLQIQHNIWIQETEGGLLVVTDASDVQLQGNLCDVDNPGAAAHSAYVIEADADDVTNVMISDHIAATAGEWAFGVELLASTSDIGVVNIVGCVIEDVDVGVTFDSSGGGNFTSVQVMMASNAIDATTAAWSSSAALFPRVGGNASTFGVNVIEGTGDPEGVVTARIGAIYMRLNGGAATTMYIKESGTGNTGWAAK